MGLQFHETVLGRTFFEEQLPELIVNLETIVKWKSRAEEENKIYVCYHENSVALEPEAGKVSNMIATTDIKGALIWLNDCIRDAEKNNFHFVQEEGTRKLYEALASEKKYEDTVYKNGDRSHAEYFRICINSSCVS